MTPEPFTVDVPDAVLDDLRAPAERTRWPLDFAQRRLALRRRARLPARSSSTTGSTSYDWRAQEAAINAFAALPDDDRRRPDPLHPRARQGAGPDAADPLARLAVDVLGLPQGHRPADRPGGLRRRPRRRLRRRRAVAAGLRLLVAADEAPASTSAHRRPVGRRSCATCSATSASPRRAATGARLVTAQLGHKHAERLIGVHLEPGDADDVLSRSRLPAEDQTPTTSSSATAQTQRAWRRRHQPRRRAERRSADARLRAARLAGRPARLDPRAPAQLERLRRRRRAPLHQGRAASRRRCSTGSPRAIVHLGALLLRGPAQPVEAVARPHAGRRGARRRSRSVPAGAGAHARALDPELLQPPAADGRCPPAATSPRWRSPSRSSRTCGRSSASCGERPPARRR